MNENFCIDHNELISLKGCPLQVSGSFYANCNQLVSLEYSPQNIGGSFSVAKNKLKTLKGLKNKIINGYFVVCNNELTSLEYGPQIVNGNFAIYNNKITNFDYLPTIKNNFIFNNNLCNPINENWDNIEIGGSLFFDIKYDKERQLKDYYKVALGQELIIIPFDEFKKYDLYVNLNKRLNETEKQNKKNKI